jgi:Cu+-exporting ATPase
MTVRADSPHRATYRGREYFFCSAGCMKKLEADPERYLEVSGVPAPQASPSKKNDQTLYTCPMHLELRQRGPGACPKCGMALEPVEVAAPATKVEWTCPMHPEIVRDGPGSCPICGMALEPRTVTLDEPENPELTAMTRRFWVGVALTIPLLVLAMSDLLPGRPLERLLPPATMSWLQLVLASPVVLWGGWPFFVRGWESIRRRSPNMFTLIALGVSVAYVESVLATLTPGIFPAAFREAGGHVAAYFEAAAVIVTLVLFGRARTAS